LHSSHMLNLQPAVLGCMHAGVRQG
jgi:hypothetical protein